MGINKISKFILIFLSSVIIGFIASLSIASDIIESTTLVGFGKAKYPADFKHFDYVNPNAPKYGKVTYGQLGTYDNFNRYASRGVAAAGSEEIYDTLMFQPSDEVDSYYPLIANNIRYSNDYSWMEVDINPKAHFNDGVPITARDVEFTFNKFIIYCSNN